MFKRSFSIYRRINVVKCARNLWQGRVISKLKEYRWMIVAGMWLSAGLLGFIGFTKYYQSIGESASRQDILYLTLQLFAMESGSVTGPLSWELEAARLLAPAATLYTAIQALAVVFREQYRRLIVRFYKNHVIICGLGKSGFWLAKAFSARGDEVVGIEVSPDNPNIEACKELGIQVLVGSASDGDLLKHAAIQRASYLIALCGDSGANAEIAVTAEQIVTGRTDNPLPCIVQIVDSHLLRLLRVREIGIVNQDSIRLEFLDIFERGAGSILYTYSPFPRDFVSVPRPLVIGAGRLGESLIVQMSRAWRRRAQHLGEPIPITVVDRNAVVRKRYLDIHYPFLERACDLRAIEIDVTHPDFYQGDILRDESGRVGYTFIYVCLDNDSLAVDTALSLLDATAGSEAPIIVRMSHQRGLAKLLQGGGNSKDAFNRIRAFGLFDQTWTPELVLGGTYERLARALHREYRERGGEHRATEHVEASKPWEDLHSVYQDSFRRQADQLVRELHDCGYAVEPLVNWDADKLRFSEEEVERMARMQHEYYVREHHNGRWAYSPWETVLGANAVPADVTWDEASESVRESFRTVVRYIPRFLANIDFQISRSGKPVSAENHAQDGEFK